MARLLAPGKHFFVLPIIGRCRLGNNEIDAQFRLPDAPALKRTVLHLPDRLSKAGLFFQAQHQAASHTRNGIRPVFVAGQFPELIGVLLLMGPLDHRLFPVTATTVQRLEGKAIHKLVDVLP